MYQPLIIYSYEQLD